MSNTEYSPGEGRSVTRTAQTVDPSVHYDLNSGSTSTSTSDEAADSSLGEIVGRLMSDVSRLMRAEIELAKAEAKEEVTQAGKGAGFLAGAGVAAHIMLIFASLALMFGLGAVMDLGWAALIVTILWAIAAAVLSSSGRKKLKKATPPLPETIETLKEDAQWAKNPRG